MVIRVLVIDDHPLVCEALVWALKTPEARYDVATACTLADGLAQLREHGCDLVLLDLGLPGCSGSDALHAVRAADAEVAVAIVSGTTDGRTIVECLQAGADGFIPKTAQREVMISALRLVLSGGKYVPPEALTDEPAEPAAAAAGSAGPVPLSTGPALLPVDRASRLAAMTRPPAASYATAYPPRMPGPSAAPLAAPAGHAIGLADLGQPPVDPRQLGLTERQTDVLWLILNGLPNKLICRRLKLAEGTVKVHVSAVLRALGVHSRTQAVVAASRMGLRPDARHAA